MRNGEDYDKNMSEEKEQDEGNFTLFVCVLFCLSVPRGTVVGLFGTGPFRDSLLGPFGTVYLALSGQFFNLGTTGGPFRDTLLGSFGTKSVPKGPSKLSPKGPL